MHKAALQSFEKKSFHPKIIGVIGVSLSRKQKSLLFWTFTSHQSSVNYVKFIAQNFYHG